MLLEFDKLKFKIKSAFFDKRTDYQKSSTLGASFYTKQPDEIIFTVSGKFMSSRNNLGAINKDNYLKIFIDSDKGIDLNDCEKVNNSVNNILDEKDYIKAQYYLEISSPGLERNLRRDEQFLDNINKKIEVHLYNSINNNKTVTGILKEYNENNIVIDDIKIEKSNITSAKTIYNWEEC